MRRIWLSALAAVLLLCFGLRIGATSASMAQLLQNGGFEAGLAGWSGSGASASGCPPRTGGAALNLTVSSNVKVDAHQDLAMSAGQGPYMLSGYAKSGGGTPTLQLVIRAFDTEGAGLNDWVASISLTPSYAPFTLAGVVAPERTASVSVRLGVSGSGTACVDDVALDGPAPIMPTVRPTETPTLPATFTPTRTATALKDTATPRPPTSTRVPSATRTPAPPKPSSTAAGQSASPSAAIGDSLVNGGFEDGVVPWQKFGGELRATSLVVHSGDAAGVLSSATTSTKWAYQAVRVNEGDVYAFEGYLQPGSGVGEAYLRISWYASGDGSGSAIGTTDSAEIPGGGGSGFSYLTTGAVEAPSGSHSARARVMLAPAGAGAAALYMDDLAFGPSEDPVRSDSIAPAAQEDQADEGASGMESAAAPLSEVHGASRAAQQPTTSPADKRPVLNLPGGGAPDAAPLESSNASEGSSSGYLLSGLLVLVGLVGAVAFVVIRRRQMLRRGT